MFQIEDDGAIRVMTMARGKGNSLDLSFLESFLDVFEAAEKSAARALVITGQSKTFCAGVDLFTLVEGGPDYIKKFLPTLSKMLLRLFEFPKPVVAAINGHAIAGGCLIALACDHRLMSCGQAKFGLTELVVGVPFPSIAFEIGRASIPPSVLREAVYDAKLFLPEECLELGMVNELVDPDQLLERSIERASVLAKLPSEVFAQTKKQIIQPRLDHHARHAADLDDKASVYWQRPETIAHIRAFLDQTIKTSK